MGIISCSTNFKFINNAAESHEMVKIYVKSKLIAAISQEKRDITGVYCSVLYSNSILETSVYYKKMKCNTFVVYLNNYSSATK